MKLRQAKVTSNEVVETTKGLKRLIVCNAVSDETELSVWRPATSDPIAEAVAVGEIVLVAIDGRGKVSLIDNPQDDIEVAKPQDRKAKILDDIARTSRLYKHCFNAARLQLADDVTISDIKDVATSLFIHITRKYNL
jgi:hypothetical protein